MILIDYRIGKNARKLLEKLDEVIPFQTEGLVYPAISGHPDIFVFFNESKIIFSPNIPNKYIYSFEKTSKILKQGKNPVGIKYPESSFYNASGNNTILITNPKNTDEEILNLYKSEQILITPQGYSRCNTIVFDNNLILSSDIVLCNKHKNSVYINPEKIGLQDFKHGFFGGCCGFYDKKLFVNGDLMSLDNHKQIIKLLEDNSIELFHLSKEPLQDIGGIFFL